MNRNSRFQGERLAPYCLLLNLLINEQLSGGEFELIFFPFYKNDPTMWDPDLFSILDSFWADVDDFTSDPELREWAGGLDDADLRKAAAETLQRLAPFLSPEAE